ncbi:MAG: CDP-alcohol phosphatidyltransferase family protein [Xanthomonadales bacterium]|nr:CDP-alcohol phosphatidyltransferase family protein [Xanthomonadales bacterium]
MTTYALVYENSDVRLWGLDSAQRIRRQLAQLGKENPASLGDIHWLKNPAEAPGNTEVLVLNGSFLFELRTLKGVLERPGSVLLHDDGSVAAALTDSAWLKEVLAAIRTPGIPLPPQLEVFHTSDMEAFDENLRRSTRPLLEAVSAERKAELENRLYGNAYRGITDLVTKFAWPKPAKHMVHLCARLHLSPNMVTTFGLLLVVAACYLFLGGYYVLGLLAGWIMTFLDTVDGKLARVTIQSSKFGHLYDHIIDLVHPPFWYIFWGMSLAGLQPVMGLNAGQMYWLIIISYAAGRAVEGLFPLLGNCSIFTWRPFDAWFRLVTARRNPCLILLTLSLFFGRPDWGFIAVVFWSALSTVILILRLLQAVVARIKDGPLQSWLSADNVARGPNAYAYSVFGATRGAYANRK